MSDEIPEQTAALQVAFHFPELQFQFERFNALRVNQCLFLMFQLHRWEWHERGIVPFLPETDRHQLALTCYAAYYESVERQTDDDLVLSPLAVNCTVVEQFA